MTQKHWTTSLVDNLQALVVKPITESSSLMEAHFAASDEYLWQLLKSVKQNFIGQSISISIVDPEAGDAYDFSDHDYADVFGKLLLIRIVKQPKLGLLRFFTLSGFQRSLQIEPEVFDEASTVLVADIEHESRTLGMRVCSWREGISSVKSSDEFVSPRTLVNDMTGKGAIPPAVANWISTDNTEGWLRQLIAQTGARRLSMCVLDQLSYAPEHSDAFVAVIKGRRRLSLLITKDDPHWANDGLYEIISAACRWVYCEGHDAEAKHSLLSSELARTLPQNTSWGKGLFEALESALESARIAYRLHLQEKGIDALKLMADLRKSLSEDVRSVAAQTSSLASGMWRDAAVAFGLIVARSMQIVGGWWIVSLGVIYLSASCYLTCRAASKAVSAIELNESSFRKRLYLPLLLDKEYQELAGSHYERVLREFRTFRALVFLFYVFMILAVCWSALTYADVASIAKNTAEYMRQIWETLRGLLKSHSSVAIPPIPTTPE